MSPHFFCVYLCGHQCGRRTAQTDRASFVSNSVNLFLFSVPTTGNVATPIFCNSVSSPLFGFSMPFPLLLSFSIPCSLFLLLTQPRSIGISQNSAALRSVVPVLILDKLDMRVTRSVVRATTQEYDSKTNLNSVEFPLCSRGLPSTNVFPDTATIRPDQPKLFRQAIRIKTRAPLSCVMK